MNDILFCKSFTFKMICHKKNVHNDNSQKGIPRHFFARMKCGTGRIRAIDGNEISLEKDDIFYLPLGLKYHSYWTPDSESGKVEWESYGFTYLPQAKDIRYSMQKINANKEARDLLDKLCENMTESVLSIGIFYNFVGEVLPTLSQCDSDPKAALYKKAEEYIARSKSFRVPELAKYCGMSESGLFAFFRSYANTTPITVKNKFLIEKAVTLLSSTDLSIEEISDSLGFCSVAYFRKKFKEITGASPSQVRKDLLYFL